MRDPGAFYLAERRTGSAHGPEKPLAISLLVLALATFLVSGCSVKRLTVNILGDSLAADSDVYASDEDPELIREALPFGLKTYESLLAVSPEHQGLLLAAAKGFTVYAYLLQDDADRIDATDVTRTRELRARAKKLYLRGRRYALSGLEVSHPKFEALVRTNPVEALASTTKKDVPFLYWAGVSWAGALSVGQKDLLLLSELPVSGALVQRVLELDERYALGAAHEFFVSYEGSRPGGSASRAREHFRRAVELSSEQRASVYLALAEAVSVPEQNLGEFKDLLAAALTIGPDKAPNLRLANTIARRRARWLETQIPDLFVEAG